MALSGKTANFELKYPAVSDKIIMGPEANDNDFKEMMNSVDSVLNQAIFKQVEQGTDLNTLGTGLYQLGMPMVNDPSPTVGLRYLIATQDSPGSAQYYFAGDGKIYYRFNARGSFTTTDEWKEISTEDIVGDLADLATTTKTDLVSAINELKTNISDNGIIDLGLVEGDLQQDEGAILLDVTGQGIYKYRVASGGEEEQEYLINAYNMFVSATTQFRFTYNSMYKRLLDMTTTSSQSVPWTKFATLEDIASKKYSTIVIGNSASGLTANDVDYLYTADSDFTTTLTGAINALPSIGGEIKILSGTYTFNSNCQIFGSSDKLIKITGEGSCTKFIGTGSCLLNYCEISNIQLSNTLTINSDGGYVTIHDCEFNLEDITGIEMSGTLGENVSRIIIKNNLLNMLSPGSSDFIKLTGAGEVFDLEIIGNHIHDNGGYGGDIQFINCIDKHITDCHIMNNDIGLGFININTHIDAYGYYNKIFGNIIGGITISAGSYWEIENNSIIGQINIHSGHNNGKIINNTINSVSSIGLSTDSTFTGNVILRTNFDVAKIPGYNDASNKWGNNMWADGIDRLVFANGEGIGGTLATPPVIYGVSIDLSNSNPETSVTYTDDAIGMTPGSNDWWNKPIFSKIKPCLFKEGKVVGYLNPNNFAEFEDGTTADITSGTAGDVMIEIPKIGYKISTEDDILTVKITNDMNKKSEGFCYYAHTRDTEGDRDNLYIGAFLGSLVDNKLRSLSGKSPLHTEYVSELRTKANANGSGYDQLAFYPLTLLQCLYLIMYKNLDSQTALGKGYVSGSSLKTTGATIANGMNYGTTSPSQQMKFLGIEDFWGNIQQWIDGLYSNSRRNILTAFKDFNNTGSGYTDRGQGATTDVNGYMKAPQGNNESAFVIKTNGGSKTTYFADYASLSAGYLPVFGGYFFEDDSAGAFHLTVNYDSLYASEDVGGRLMFL